jgi:uncharacterized protein
VNLYVPSRVSWKQGGTELSLVQHTDYPNTAHSELVISANRPEAFALNLRIPTWAGAKTTVAVNGKHLSTDLTPGRFTSVKRTWKDGDRIEVEFDMPLQLEAVDPQHSNLVALLNGPLALFAVGDVPAKIARADLLSARQISKGSTNWEAHTSSGILRMKPFASIQDEGYRLYQNVEG